MARYSKGSNRKNWYKTSGYASSLGREDMVDERRKMRKSGYSVSHPYKNRLNGQSVWTIKYRKRPRRKGRRR